MGSQLRPHFKTIRAREALPHLLTDKSSPITVSTLREAEAVADEGYTNIIYAVGIVAAKLPRVRNLMAKGVDAIVLLDSREQAW